jgi:hypothetical protein
VDQAVRSQRLRDAMLDAVHPRRNDIRVCGHKKNFLSSSASSTIDSFALCHFLEMPLVR